MLQLLNPDDPYAPFPPVSQAEIEPDGLLAVGGDLSPERLLNAYQHGIFPWYSDDQPILWWSPDPRMVLFPEKIKISRSLRKSLRNRSFQVTFDHHFEEVIRACGEPRGDGDGTWITEEMIGAYCQLNNLGYAHSVEVWRDNLLVGGLYGVALGGVFFGESMFSRESDASKVALVHLVVQISQWGYRMIDCQIHSAHLGSLGAEEIPRSEFSDLLEKWCETPGKTGSWQDMPALSFKS
ncbi:MAG: leucyl/phenylalanyl-tRNA--protein transferase [Candidatus Sedimenticola sp. (ex Thyasira tokunagai)]